jgi:diadenylate cyclase
MIEFLFEQLVRQFTEFWDFMRTNYDPFRDTVDIALVFFAVYWLLLLLKGTRAVQIMAGLMALIAARLISEFLQLVTLIWILDSFFTWGWVIIIVVFQADIRRVLARVGRGFFPQLSELQESHILEEIVRASQILAQKRVGALIVLERENSLEDLIEAGTPIDAAVSKELLIALFLPYSPLHDGAVLIREGRISHAGSILPLTLRTDLPEGVGTRHRAAVGVTEEADAVVIVVSEETATISVVMAGGMTRDLDAPRLRVVLRDLLTRSEREPEAGEQPVEKLPEEGSAEGKGPAGATGAVGTP